VNLRNPWPLILATLACQRDLDLPAPEEPLIGIIEFECSGDVIEGGQRFCDRFVSLTDALPTATRATFRMVHAIEKTFPPMDGLLDLWHAPPR
jgi:hypothetical protein